MSTYILLMERIRMVTDSFKTQAYLQTSETYHQHDFFPVTYVDVIKKLESDNFKPTPQLTFEEIAIHGVNHLIILFFNTDSELERVKEWHAEK